MGKKRGWANYYALKRRRILFSLTEKSIILKFYDFIHYNYEKKTGHCTIVWCATPKERIHIKIDIYKNYDPYI